MPNPLDVLDKIHSKMFMKQMDVNVTIEEDDDSFEDVPYIDDEDEYKTNLPISPVQEQDENEEDPESRQQNEETPKEEPQPPDNSEEAPQENPETADQGMGNEGGGEEEIPPEGQGMEGEGGGVEGEIDVTEIGRVFELKKIYSRLTSIESYLSDSSDTTLLKLRNYVSQSIELFEILIANVKSFKDKLDEIIIIYYKFIEIVYGLLNKYYEDQEKKMDDKGGVTKFN